MRQTETALIALGLTQTEAQIYLAGLAYASISVQELAKKTTIKRPTIYHAINTLLEKGLVAEHRVGNKVRFSMCPPEQIRTFIAQQKAQLNRREQKLEEIIPLLADQHSSQSHKEITSVQYEGIEGVKMVLDIAFHAKSHKWDIIAPIQNFLKEYDPEYAKHYLQARKYHGITARTLWEHKASSRVLTAQEIKERNPRFMPAIMQERFKSMIILFDDKVAIISSLEKLSALLITSKEIHGLFQAMFDGIWEVSTPVDSVGR